MALGPKDPFTVFGEPEVTNLDRVDGYLRRQRYEDGWLYQASIPIGAPFDGAGYSVLGALPKGQFMDSWSDEDHHHISVWVANN